MAFDGLTTYTIVQELKNHIINGKIDKIFEPNSNEIILGIYCNGIKYSLDINTSSNFYRICLTNSTKVNPAFAPNFCMVLRKHLLNTKITKVDILGLERIVIIEVEGHNKVNDNEPKKIIVELMGKHSNIILVDSKNVIIDALKHFRIENNSYRNIIPNTLYTLPISHKLNFIEMENNDIFYKETVKYIQEFLQITEISNSLKLSDMISNTYTGISKNSVISILHELQIEDTFNEMHIRQIYEYLHNIIYIPTHVIVKPFKANDYSVCLTSSVKNQTLEVNYFIDNFYVEKETLESFVSYRDNLSKLILSYLKRLTQKLSNINQKLKECQNTELYKLYGELIISNLYRINDKHTDRIKIENYYNNNELITIPLDKSITPSMNAKRYFKKYHKLQNAKQIVELQKKEVETEINYLESIIYEFELATTTYDIDSIYQEFSENFMYKYVSQDRKSHKKSKNQTKQKKSSSFAAKFGTLIEYSIDGFKVIIGKNNQQNDYITKNANDNDIWFHAKDIHGSHVILKTDGKVPSQDIINQVASLTAFYSKATQSSNVSVDYTLVKYVKKPSKAKPGMVIYTNNKTVIVKPKNTKKQ